MVAERRLAAAALFAAAFLLAWSAAHGQCLDGARIARLADDWFAGRPVHDLHRGMSLADSACTRDRLVAELSRRGLGPVAGYKAGLTSAAVQARFGVAHPVRGTLLAGMLVPAGRDPLPLAGARPVVEADLLVEVGDAAINGARDRDEAARALAAVFPFIELPDLVFAPGVALDAARITAINVGARRGVVGRRIPLRDGDAIAARLSTMRVIVTDGEGAELARAPGSAILGHPLDAVLWLVRDLTRAGVRLAPGDLLSLGAFGPPLPARPGMRVVVRYEGLPGDPEVAVLLAPASWDTPRPD